MKHTDILMAMGLCLMASCSNQSSEFKAIVNDDCLTDVVMRIDNFDHFYTIFSSNVFIIFS